MDKETMVSTDVDQGLEIVRILEAGDLKLNLALWALLPEYEGWRLVLASRHLDRVNLQSGYGMIRTLLAPEGFTIRNTPTIMILRMNDPFVKAVRQPFLRAKNVEGMRIGYNVFGDRYLEDAYVYRVA